MHGADYDDHYYGRPRIDDIKHEQPGWENDVSKVDKNGWRWCFTRNRWFNTRTHVEVITLTYRRYPDYMRKEVGEEEWNKHNNSVLSGKTPAPDELAPAADSVGKAPPPAPLVQEIISWHLSHDSDERSSLLYHLCTLRKGGLKKGNGAFGILMASTVQNTHHLSNQEKGWLCKESKRLFHRIDPGFDYAVLTTPEKLMWFRMEVESILGGDVGSAVTDKEVDNWILSELKTGGRPWMDALDDLEKDESLAESTAQEDAATTSIVQDEPPEEGSADAVIPITPTTTEIEPVADNTKVVQLTME